MTASDVETKVRSVLAEKLGVAYDKAVPDARLVDDLAMDSFAAIEVVFELEDVFAMKIPDKDMAAAVWTSYAVLHTGHTY